MRAATRLAIAVALAAPSPLLAAKALSVSWGKPGISFEQYRRDAVECGRSGYYRDVSDTEAAKIFASATRMLAAVEGGGSGTGLDQAITSASIVAATRPEQRFQQVRQILQGTVDGCLVDRGYTPFRLTADQRNRLRKLHLGSAERHAYLFGLASDPEVIRTQQIGSAPQDLPGR